jgi:general secretion pathway protein G
MKFPSSGAAALAVRLKFENPDAVGRSPKVPGAEKVRQHGFTLIEMVVVISMILILLAIALPMYNQSIVRAREAKLHQNLTTLNKVIQEYSLDKKKAPQSLDDLVPSYLKYIPEDITGKSDTWVTEAEDPENAWDANQAGIASVHSGSNEASSDGTQYSSWTH